MIRWAVFSFIQQKKNTICRHEFLSAWSSHIRFLIPVHVISCNNLVLPYLTLWYLLSFRNINIFLKIGKATLSQLACNTLVSVTIYGHCQLIIDLWDGPQLLFLYFLNLSIFILSSSGDHRELFKKWIQ